MVMEYSSWRAVLFTIIALMAVVGCTGSGTTSKRTAAGSSGSSVTVDHTTLTLADYLRRMSGITVQGSGNSIRVVVRGIHSVTGNNEPLFVIDGRRAGRSYEAAASQIDVSDIDRITLIKGSEAGSRYGFEGNAGVIEIRTKRD